MTCFSHAILRRPVSHLNRALILAVLTAMPLALPCGANAADQEPALKVKAKPIIDSPFFTYVDNRLSYAYIFSTTDAGYFSQKPNGTYDGKTSMQVVAFTHFDTWAYGTNFFTVLASKAGKNDPAAPCTNAGQVTDFGGTTLGVNCAGATDIYGLIRSTFGLNEIFDTHAFSMGPLRNVSLEVGADADSQNTYFASAKRSYAAGLQFAFDLPYKGYIDIAPLYYKDFGHNGFTQCGSVFANPLSCNADGNTHFNGTWAIETNYYMDLGFLPPSLQFFAISGRAGWYGPKGNFHGLAGQESTKVELNSEPIRLTFDAGKAIWGNKRSHEVDLWVAYRYWRNQYGNDQNSAPFVCTVNGVSTNSCTSSTAVTGVTVKF